MVTLQDLDNDPKLLNKLLKKCRETRLNTVNIDECGIKSASDIRAIINNKATEKVDWTPLYKAAETFD